MRELSKNDWRVLEQVLEIARYTFSSNANKDFALPDTQDNRFLWRNVLDAYGFHDVEMKLVNGILWTRGDLLMDFFASIARENANGDA